MQGHSGDPFGIVGQVLDAQFRVDRLVGEGGFSAVYRGHHLSLDEPIAIKCLKLPPTLSPPLVDQFAQRFRDESRILYRLSQGNLNIVRSIAGGTWTSPVTGVVVPYMALEWLEGRSLVNEFTIRRTVGNSGRSLADVVKLFGSAADGLGYAHLQGVVHRDLNPGNLFLATTPTGPRMKVLDFGVAKILDDSTLNIARMQTVGQIRIFAPAYGAPEQFDDGIGPVGAATDVYAFALILLEAMRDRCVNDGQHLGEFAQRATDPSVRPTPRMLGIEVPDEVEQIFARATKLDPRERWQSVAELWQALAIAASAASQQKHVQAALETPPLVMPAAGTRATKTGMGPPPGAKSAGRIDKTMPIGAVKPSFPLPKPQGSMASPPAPRVAAVTPRASSPEAQPAEVPRLNPESDDDAATMINAPIAPAAIVANESEDEVTRVRPPEPDVLRDLSELSAVPGPRGFAGAVTMTQLSRGASASPRPAAGMPADVPAPIPAAGQPPSRSEAPSDGSSPLGVTMAAGGGYPPSGGGMAPGGGGMGGSGEGDGGGQGPRRPPAGNLAKTMPLMGAHPLGIPQQGPTAGPLPAAGAPMQQPPMQQPPMQQPPMQQPPMGYGQPPPQPMGYGQQPPQPMGYGQPPMQQHSPSMHGGYPQGGQGYGQPPMQQPGMPPAHAQPQGGPMDEPPPPSVAGVPKKGGGVLIAVIVAAVLLVVGVIAIVFVVMKSDKTEPGSVASNSASATAAPPPAPAPVPTPAPAPAPTETAAVNTEVDAGGAVAVDPTPAPAPAPEPSPAPGPAPGPNVSPQPAPGPAPTPVAVKDAGAPANPDAFSESTARARLNAANSLLPVFCKKEGGVNGAGSASVTFGPDGSVTEVAMNAPYAGTPTGDCVAGQFRRTKTSSFKGAPQTVKHSFNIPK